MAGLGFALAVLAGAVSPGLARIGALPVVGDPGEPWVTVRTLAGGGLGLAGVLARVAQSEMGAA